MDAKELRDYIFGFLMICLFINTIKQLSKYGIPGIFGCTEPQCVLAAVGLALFAILTYGLVSAFCEGEFDNQINKFLEKIDNFINRRNN